MQNSSTNRTGMKVDKQDDVMFLWNQFNEDFPTEDDCVEALCRIIAMNKQPACRTCGSCDLTRHSGQRIGKCKACGRSVFFTAGTFFDGIRQARPWLAAIWFLERGVAMSAKRFHELAGIAYSTSWMIHRKLSYVINSTMANEDAACEVLSDNFSAAICKRSKETPAKKHPLSEQEEIELQCSYDRTAELDHLRKVEEASSVYPCTSFICKSFHGISRKYLQIYLAAFWCKVDRLKWTVNSLLAECSRFGQISSSAILEFISPLIVKVMLANQ